MIRLKVYIATSSPLYWLLSLELRCKQKIGVLYNLWACLGSMSFLRKEHWARVTLTLIYHVYSCTMVVLGKEQVTGDMRLYYKWPSIMDWTLVHGRFTRVWLFFKCWHFRCFKEHACNNSSCYFPIHLATFDKIFLFLKFKSCINAFLPKYMSYCVLYTTCIVQQNIPLGMVKNWLCT